MSCLPRHSESFFVWHQVPGADDFFSSVFVWGVHGGLRVRKPNPSSSNAARQTLSSHPDEESGADISETELFGPEAEETTATSGQQPSPKPAKTTSGADEADYHMI